MFDRKLYFLLILGGGVFNNFLPVVCFYFYLKHFTKSGESS